MAASRYALVNGYVLDGSADMKPREGLVVVVSDGKFEAVAPERELDLSGCVRIDLAGGYIMPGLVNMHVHLASAGKAPKPNAKPVDYKGLMEKLGKYRPVKHLFYKMAKKYAATELKSGVTTLRAVGGLFDIDGRVRDAVEAGKVAGPRIIAANTGVSVPGGHFAGSLATEATTPEEAAADVRRAVESGADIIKLMITGGVMDATAEGEPGALRMPPELVKAACDDDLHGVVEPQSCGGARRLRAFRDARRLAARLVGAFLGLGERHRHDAFDVVPLVVGGSKVLEIVRDAVRRAQVAGLGEHGRPLGEHRDDLAVGFGVEQRHVGAVARDARIVDEDIYLAEIRRHRFDRRRNLLGHRDVALICLCLHAHGAKLLTDQLALFHAHIDHGDVGAVRRQTQRDLSADTL